MASTAELAILLTARDMASKQIEGLGKSLGGLGGLGKVAQVGLAAVAGAGVALVGGLGASISSAADFQAILSQVGAVSGATASELSGLSDLALQMGADTSFSASEAAQAMAELAKGGISVKDMAAVLPGTLDLAAAGGLGLAEAATIATDSMAIFATQGVTMDQVANAFAGAANISSISVEDMAEAMKYAGPVAASMGIKMEDVSAAVALLGANGIKASSAGTGLRTMMLGLAAPTDKARGLMKDLGLQFFDSNGKMKDFAGISDELKSKLKGMSDAQRAATLETLFGKEGMSAAIAIMGEGDNSIKSYTQRLKDAATANATGKAMLDNFSGSMEQLKGSIETAAITLGLAFLPVLRSVVDSLTGAVNAAVPFIKQYGPVLVAALQQGIGVLLQWGGAVWGAVSAVIGAFQALLSGQITLAQFIGGMETFVTTILGKLGNLAQMAAPYIGQFFSAIGSAIVTYGPQILAQFGLWLGSLVEWFGTTAVPAIATAAGNLASALGGWIQGTAIPYLTTSLPLWRDALVGWLTDTAIPEVTAAATSLANALGEWIRGTAIPFLAANMPFWIDALKSWIVDSAIPTVVGAVVGLSNAFVDWIKDAETRTNFNKWVGIIASALGEAISKLLGFDDQATPLLSEWIKSETTKEKLKKLAQDVDQSLGDILTALADFSGQAGLDLNQWIQESGPKWLTSWTELGRVVDAGAKQISTYLNQLQQDMNNKFDEMLRSITPKWSHSWGEMFTAMSETGGNIMAEVGTWGPRILAALGDLGGLLVGAGRSLVQGLLNGINSMAGEVIGRAREIANLVTDAIRDALQIHSPSKVMADIGKDVVLGLVEGMDATQQEAVNKAAQVASAVAKAVTDTLAALKALGALRLSALPSGAKVSGFLASLSDFMEKFSTLAGDFETDVLEAAGKFADAAGKATGLVKNAVDGLTAIGKFTAPLDSAISTFLASLADFMEKFSTVAGGFEADTLTDATAFADAAAKVGGSVGSALKGLQELAAADWAKSSPTGSAMGWFTHLIASLVENFRRASELFDAQGLADASAFADSAGKVGGAVGNALKGLQELANADWAKSSPSGSAMSWFTHLIASLVENFRVAAQMFSDEGLKQAAAFADAASKVLGIIGNGVQGLLALNTFVAPSKKAIDDFLNAALYVVQRFGDVATTLSTEGITKTTAFATAAGQALGATKTGVDAFLAFKGLVIPSKEAIDNLMNGMQYVILRMQDMATAVGTDGLKRAEDFAVSAGKIFATVKAGIDLLSSLKTYKDLPAKAIDELLKGFKLLFERMGELQGQANAFEQQADTFLTTMQSAAQKIAKGLALNGAAPTIGADIRIDSGGGGRGDYGTSGGANVTNVTVTGNTLLSESPTLAKQLADLITPAQTRMTSYSY